MFRRKFKILSGNIHWNLKIRTKKTILQFYIFMTICWSTEEKWISQQTESLKTEEEEETVGYSDFTITNFIKLFKRL